MTYFRPLRALRSDCAFIVTLTLSSSRSKNNVARRISQHHYSSTFCSGTPGVLQDLMSKSYIRGNLTQFELDIAAVQQIGLTYVLGETNSISCHGAPNVSNTAGASLWALDYVLFAGQLGITRVYFHNGIGFRYNFVRSSSRTFLQICFLT